MSETLTPIATLVGNFVRSIGLECLLHTHGNPVTIVLYRGIPFIERKYHCVVARLSIFEVNLNCHRVVKNTTAIKFSLDNQNLFMEVYLKQDGTVHVQIYENQDALGCYDVGKMPVFKLAHVTWNDVDLGWFQNLSKP